jgi:endoglucanase
MSHRHTTFIGLAALLSVAVGGAEVIAPTPLQPWERTDGLPVAKQGKFPVHMPKYEGVDQLLLLSSRWAIVVTTDQKEVFDKINELSGGRFYGAIETWQASDKAGKPNWTAYKDREKIHDDFVAQARELVGERKLDAPAFYTVTGTEPAYRSGAAPRRVTRVIVGLGGWNVGPARARRGVTGVFYAHYSYLEMPTPLQHGRQYTIALGSGKRVTFTYDELRTVSRAIKVNQMGYLPDARRKCAYLGACLYELGPHDFSFAKEFKVVSAATGEVAFTGTVKLREQNPRFAPRPGKDDKPEERPLIAGEDVYELDFTGLKADGEFFLTVPGVGRSWTFRHARDAYGEAFYTACRGLYHQRCGIPLEAKYTPWTRIECHKEPVCESEHIAWGAGADFKRPEGYEVFDVIGATTDATRQTADPRGGWHDAADWDRNIHHYSCAFDLLSAYELAPRSFTDGQLNLPESGNGIPDILDEAEFGIEIWKRSMTPDGGVSGMVETWTHPRIDDPEVKYSFSRRTRWSSLLFAAAAAQYAHLVKPFSPAKSAEYAAAAKRAYAFGADPRNSLGKVTIPAKKNRGKGDAYSFEWEEKDEMVKPFLAHAQARLFLLTGEAPYLSDLSDPTDPTDAVLPPYQWPNRYVDFSPWLYFDLCHKLADKLPADTVRKWREFFLGKADELAAMNDAMPYRCSWPRHQDYWMGWGATCMTNYSRALLIGYALTGDAKYREAAIQNADFMFGADPLGMSWTTGIGCVYPIDFQHNNSETDGIMDPVPGLTVYGVTGGSYPDLRNAAWRSPKAAGSQEYVDFVRKADWERPVFRQWSCHPWYNTAQCEFTVHETMASTIFTCALLMSEGWAPTDELKRRQPRAEEWLFGYWYLP